MKRRLKINGVIIFMSTLLVVFFPFIFLRRGERGLLDEIGQIFRASARDYKSTYSQEGRFLIQSGPYALVRNPMYFGILFIGVGVILVLFNWQAAVLFSSFFAIRYMITWDVGGYLPLKLSWLKKRDRVNISCIINYSAP
jgi:hypothetical protein